MTRAGVVAFVGFHTVVVWTAMLLRIDEFPLTWAPMYAVQPKVVHGEWTVVQKDLDRLDRDGWLARTVDGREEHVRRRDLNVAARNMWRLYYERTWLQSPPRYKHKNSGGATLDRRLLGVAPGEPMLRAEWDRRLLTSVNQTLGRKPGAPDFIVSLSAERLRVRFDSHTLTRVGEELERAEVHWRAAWSAEFPQ